jgi:diguanylate cyclase (GGDEF)-like protein/PAS domain S-box-containing protein
MADMSEERLSILVVEDDEVDQKAFIRHVKSEKLPYDYDIAGSLAEGRALLKKKRYDLVISDYFLGDGTGFDLIAELDDTPLIFATGTGDEEIAVKAMKSGAYDYLIKDPESCYLKVLPITVEMALMNKKRERQILMLSQAMQSVKESVCVTDTEGRISFVNEAFTGTFGYLRGEVLGKELHAFFKGRGHRAFMEVLSGSSGLESWQGELESRRKNGETFPISLSISRVKDELGKTVGYAVIIRDITELKRYEEQIQYMAYHDQLTDLPNRRFFFSRLGEILGNRRQEPEPVALLFLDLDQFKQINDSMGHDVGDHLLRAVARRLAQTVRGDDFVSRMGGDEFTFILRGLRSREEAALVANRILRCFDDPFTVEGGAFRITGSLGVSFYPLDGRDAITLVKKADAAMYRAKSAGGSAVFFSGDLEAEEIRGGQWSSPS